MLGQLDTVLFDQYLKVGAINKLRPLTLSEIQRFSRTLSGSHQKPLHDASITRHDAEKLADDRNSHRPSVAFALNNNPSPAKAGANTVEVDSAIV